jgi:hypothetical protein
MPKLSEEIKPIAMKVKIEDAKKVKDYLKTKGMKAADVDKEKWDTAEDIIESVVKLHGGTLEAYRQGGLG